MFFFLVILFTFTNKFIAFSKGLWYNGFMISSFDLQNLKELLKNFHTAVGIRISIFDDAFKPVAEYPIEAPLFCRLVRRSKAGAEACAACDRAACVRAKKLRGPHIYTCHAGLTEAITPIQIGGGVVGYAILAHIMPVENHAERTFNACLLASKYGADINKARRALKEFLPRTAEQINAAVTLLDALASYMHIRNLARWKSEDISADIDKYIKENLASDLSSEALCRHFGCCRTVLYNISSKAFGMGIMQYVSYLRVQRAKYLLSYGNTVAETAEKCGYAEYNYFCKVFRKQVGVSPAVYARENKVVY